MKRGTIEHAKTAKLARLLNVPRYAAVGILESLWHATAKHAPRGDIGRITDDDIAFYVGWDREPAELIAALVAARWLDEDEQHRLKVHDWHEHADDSVKKTIRNRGEQFVTLPELSGTFRKIPEVSPLPKPEPKPVPEPNAPSAQDAPIARGADRSRQPRSARRWEDSIKWSADRGWHGITEADLAAWGEAYPALDVQRQLRQMTQWLLANRARAHKSNWRAFIVRWLKREQDKGGDLRGRPPDRASPGGAHKQNAWQERIAELELLEQQRNTDDAAA